MARSTKSYEERMLQLEKKDKFIMLDNKMQTRYTDSTNEIA